MSLKDENLDAFKLREMIKHKIKSFRLQIEEDALDSIFICIKQIRKDEILDVELGLRILEKAIRILNVENILAPNYKKTRIKKRDVLIAFEIMKDYEVANLRNNELTEEGLLHIASKLARRSKITEIPIEELYTKFVNDLATTMNTDFLNSEKESILLLANEKLREMRK